MSNTIDILMAIDTEGIRSKYPRNTNSSSPVNLPSGFAYMIGPQPAIQSGQGTYNLSIYANVGDELRMCAVSNSNNFEDAVLLYNISKSGGTQVTGTFVYQDYQKLAIRPNSETEPLPAKTTAHDVDFLFYQANITKVGTENYIVYFALYPSDIDPKNPVPYGYYTWDPTITVSEKKH